MATRLRSPNYPSIPLGDAIDLIGKMFGVERTNPVEREVAAKAMGYTGLTGRSTKVLSDVAQYGLLERVGKGEVRVSGRAVEIIHPADAAKRSVALREAFDGPDLFRQIDERFSDGPPSETAMRSFLLRAGFGNGAIPDAARAYLDSYRYLREQNVIESHRLVPPVEQESSENQSVPRSPEMKHTRVTTPETGSRPDRYEPIAAIPVGMLEDGSILVRTRIRTKKDAARIRALIEALEGFLPEDAPTTAAPASQTPPDESTS